MAKIRGSDRFGTMKLDRGQIKTAMRERMREMGLNVATLARRASVSYDTPRDFLVREKSGMPAADKLVAMLKVLNLTHLLTDTTPASRNGLKAMRERRGYSLDELAARMTRMMVKELRKLEAGGPLSFERKVKLAAALECRTDDLDAPSAAPAPSFAMANAAYEPAPRAWKGKDALSKKGKPSVTDGGWTAYHAEFLPGVPHQFLGKTCVVRLDDGRLLIRRVEPGPSPGRYLLESLNPSGRAIKDAFVEASAIVTRMVQR